VAKENFKAKRSLATLADYQSIFGSDAGKRVLWDLMKHSNMMAPCTINGDPYATHYNDGMRSVCLYVLQKINADAKKLQEMLERGQNEERAWNVLEG
jgi:hypothetical protein